MPPKKRGGGSRGRPKKSVEAGADAEPIEMEIDERPAASRSESASPPRSPSKSLLSSKNKDKAKGKYDEEYADISSDPSTPSHSDKEAVDEAGLGLGDDQSTSAEKSKKGKKKKIKKRVYLKAAISSKIDESIDPNSVRTFIFEEEDHTLGNPLTYIISNYPDVVFCGYSVPHPAEHVLHLRIQCRYGVSATDILKRGLKDLEQVCTATKNIFKKSLKKYEREGPHKTDDDEGLLSEQMS